MFDDELPKEIVDCVLNAYNSRKGRVLTESERRTIISLVEGLICFPVRDVSCD